MVTNNSNFATLLHNCTSKKSNILLTNLYLVTFATFLCTLFYLLGLWHHDPSSAAISATGYSVADGGNGGSAVCLQLNNSSAATPSFAKLDFSARHYLPDPPLKAARGPHLPPCDPSLYEYTPCEDPTRSLRFPRSRLIYRERHCPAPEEVLRCRIPAPYGYKLPLRWPASRDSAWYANVPHKELTVEKKKQNWIRFERDRFRFPGGGTMFPRGASAYIDDIGKLINLRDGSIRTAIDTGCGVASWGAYLLSRDILTVSFAPRDTHEAQEGEQKGKEKKTILSSSSLGSAHSSAQSSASVRLRVPPRSASSSLLFASYACARFLWSRVFCSLLLASSAASVVLRDLRRHPRPPRPPSSSASSLDGIYLTEVDRVLRPGGYWILSGPPINWEKHWKGWERSRESLKDEQDAIEDVAKSLCWKKLVQKGDLAIWQKPTNHMHCKIKQKIFKTRPFCKEAQDPDMAWYTKMDTCLTPLPEVNNIKEVAAGELSKWPKRLTSIPPRISSESLEGITAEMFKENTELWKKRVAHYKTLDPQLAEHGRYRNLLDMNAYLGGFAASLVDDPVWVMNIVPVEAQINTLGVIYERGLIGTYQNWCEAMSTYPRTYDFIHGDSVFSLYQNRCSMENILLELDRILRPQGGVILRDDVDVLMKVKSIADEMQWDARITDHEEGPYQREKILVAVKQYWTAPPPEQN